MVGNHHVHPFSSIIIHFHPVKVKSWSSRIHFCYLKKRVAENSFQTFFRYRQGPKAVRKVVDLEDGGRLGVFWGVPDGRKIQVTRWAPTGYIYKYGVS